MPLDLTGVIGSDGMSPIYDPDARWCIWELSEIWDGIAGNKKYVPKVNDYALETSCGFPSAMNLWLTIGIN